MNKNVLGKRETTYQQNCKFIHFVIYILEVLKTFIGINILIVDMPQQFYGMYV